MDRNTAISVSGIWCFALIRAWASWMTLIWHVRFIIPHKVASALVHFCWWPRTSSRRSIITLMSPAFISMTLSHSSRFLLGSAPTTVYGQGDYAPGKEVDPQMFKIANFLLYAQPVLQNQMAHCPELTWVVTWARSRPLVHQRSQLLRKGWMTKRYMIWC